MQNETEKEKERERDVFDTQEKMIFNNIFIQLRHKAYVHNLCP